MNAFSCATSTVKVSEPRGKPTWVLVSMTSCHCQENIITMFKLPNNAEKKRQ